MDSDCPLLRLLAWDYVLLGYFTLEEALWFLAKVCTRLRKLVTDMDRGFFKFPVPEYELTKTERRIEFLCKRRPLEMSILVDFARMLNRLQEQGAIRIRGSLRAWTKENTYTRMNILGWHHVNMLDDQAQAWFEAQERFEQQHAGSKFYTYTPITVRNMMFALNVDAAVWRTVCVNVNGAPMKVDIPVRWELQTTTLDFRKVMQHLIESVD